jgi:hypothetical protein
MLAHLGISGRHLPLKIAVPAKQGSSHHWKFLKVHTGLRFAHGVQPYVCVQCTVDGQSIAMQRLSKHIKTHATIEVRVFIAHCWATSSAQMNSLATNNVTCFLCDWQALWPLLYNDSVNTFQQQDSFLCGQHGG